MLIGIFYSQIVESSSLVSVLFGEVFSHPYISFFHLLVNGFSVTCVYMSEACMYLACMYICMMYYNVCIRHVCVYVVYMCMYCV